MPERSIAIEGPMFSGKTLELIQIAQRETIAGRKVLMFKPVIGDRGEGLDKVESRCGGQYDAIALHHPYDILERIDGIDTVIVDEVQFWKQKDNDDGYAVVKLFQHLVEKGVRIYYAGLARDLRGEPFGPMGELLARAQERVTLTAVCDHLDSEGKVCGRPATETQRFVDGKPARWDDPVILVGDREEGYAARCVEDHVVRDKPEIVFDRRQNE